MIDLKSIVVGGIIGVILSALGVGLGYRLYASYLNTAFNSAWKSANTVDKARCDGLKLAYKEVNWALPDTCPAE